MSLTPTVVRIRFPDWFEPITPLHTKPDQSLHLVFNRRDERREVLKLAHPGSGEDVRRALVDEFLLLERIHHPHWVRTYGFLHLPDGSWGYRMEALKGPLDEGSAPPGWTPRDPEAVRQVLGALSALHAIGHAHLDLKPQQILEGERGACLVDPGLAAAFGAAVSPRGTWGYIAPEILSSKAWDRRADLFSLGCVLVRIWTGENPFGEGDVVEQIRRLGSRPRLRLRERLDGVPEGLDRVVENMLDPDPERRPRNAAEAWEVLHTLAGFREHYLERRQLPIPSDVPFFSPPGVEEDWRSALAGRGVDRWRIEGPIGSGRRRLLARLRAIAETIGGGVTVDRSSMRVAISRVGDGHIDDVVCRIGEGGTEGRVVQLGSHGDTASRAALEAYGLTPEGDEAGWTRTLLRLRLEERRGGEEARRASSRGRRALAAGFSARLPGVQRRRLAETLVAEESSESTVGSAQDPLVLAGFLRVEGKSLRPATPPWEREALEVLAGSEEIRAAHARLLQKEGSGAIARARHALGAHDRAATRATLPAAVEALRLAGDLGSAMDLLARAEQLLQGECPADWVTLHAELALEDGDPARCFPLAQRADLPEEWRSLLQALLLHRGGRRGDALTIARELRDSCKNTNVARRAGTLLMRILLLEGRYQEASAEGAVLLDGIGPETPAADKVRIAHAVLDLLSIQGAVGPQMERARGMCEELLQLAGARERCLVATSLGADAFRRGDFHAAKQWLVLALGAARDWGDVGQIATAQINAAGVYYEEGRLADCEALNQAVLAAGPLILPSTLTSARRNLATVLHAAGRWGESLALWRQTREAYQEIGVYEEADAALLSEGSVLLASGLLESAEEVARTLERRLSVHPQPILEGILWREIGQLKRIHRDRNGARACWANSLKAARAARAEDEEARTTLEAAGAEIAWSQFERASVLGDLTRSLFGDTASLELKILCAFVRSMSSAVAGGREEVVDAGRRLREAASMAADAELRPWTWRCRAAEAGLSNRLGDVDGTLVATMAARDALRELLGAIGTEALQESYLLLPEPRLFLAWCDRTATRADLTEGVSNLEVFLR